MAKISYLDFDLLIEREGKKYRALVLNSPAGQATTDFRLPFSEVELENFLLRVGRTRRGVRRLESPEMEVAKTFGGHLFNAVFSGDVRACLHSSLDETSQKGAGLRIRLRLAAVPELADVPWEYIYNPSLNRFLSLSAETPLVRYLDLPERIQPLAVKPPLRLLVMISSPSDYPQLNVEQEWGKLSEALDDLERRGLVALERLEEATLPALQRRLRQVEYHIFHFIGHGGFDQQAQDGVLVMEDEAGRGRQVSGNYLGMLLHDERTLRLAVLNACEGARASRTDPFAGTAQSLVQQGISAVIAMQFEITDEAAITLAQEFYSALADGYPVDAALAEARKAIFAQGNDVEWATPVLYLRSPDGRIFAVERVSEEKKSPVQITTRKPQEAVNNNLPIQLTSFIGREQEMAEVKRLLSTTRLLTLTGAGGCGKTRLALEVARGLLETYADGVWLVELATLEDPALVPQAVASVLGVREEPDHPLTETLANSLRPRELLLVLDNCEHLVEACAVLAYALLCACPKLRILITSREVLHIWSELAWSVPPLTFPDPKRLPPWQKLPQYEAVHLFVERALLNQPEFALTEQNAAAVAQICQRLDGIPLAIELAAARVRVLSVEQIAARLDDCFRLLTSGWRRTLPRHQTLRATVDWSYDLLSEQERLLFNRLAVFVGGFTLEAAEAVGAGDGVEAYNVLDLLSQLVDKSLVAAEEGTDGSVRYRLLETLRQYGRERLLASGKLEETQRRHAAYFLALAEEAEPKLTGPEQTAWLNRLEVENDNLRAALYWTRASGAAETGLRLSGALWWFWYIRGYYGEGRERLIELLALPGAAERTALRAKALKGVGVLAHYQGDYAAARSLYEESLAIGRELGDKKGIAASLNNLGGVAYQQGDYAKARSIWEECLVTLRELDDKRGIAHSLNNLGLVAYEQGDYAVARSMYMESLAIRRELGDRWGIADSLNHLGEVALEQGDYATARSLYEESLAIRRELGDKRGIAQTLHQLGMLARDQGDYAVARSLQKESLVIFKDLGDRWGIAYSLESFVGLAAAQAQPERALRLAGAAAALRQAIGAPLSPVEQARLERHLETARQALGEEASSRALAAGQAMTLEQAIAYALEESAKQEDAPS